MSFLSFRSAAKYIRYILLGAMFSFREFYRYNIDWTYYLSVLLSLVFCPKTFIFFRVNEENQGRKEKHIDSYQYGCVSWTCLEQAMIRKFESEACADIQQYTKWALLSTS